MILEEYGKSASALEEEPLASENATLARRPSPQVVQETVGVVPCVRLGAYSPRTRRTSLVGRVDRRVTYGRRKRNKTLNYWF
jgi:hypothetical protein